ncbi:DNA polymerase III subunit delta' [Chroogloeocystis siderophila]|jgi:DNA polymerase-3 subunit delta'|uniref:DNA polymerase III subunit delta n=1 Tax=Chroogloeocystis siderophila 5.2 s.c.1 TaxID=247279 RepID=A0A1U7HN50_9CHRO|nr:DNA polymerase III subunit delta' [Chroogloeocystis siderophila]OKH24997.1 DNA polymerase III subunit delta' [Chroogloeocystis siderophila 5.2 s.c.1]
MSNFFAPVIGQTQAIALLTQAIDRQRIAPAYLFVGSPGVGRSLTAQCFIQQIFCTNVPVAQHPQIKQRVQLGNHPDVLWVQPTYLHQGQRLTAAEAADAGVKRKAPPIIRVEQVREIAQFLSRSPLEASRNLVVIEQAETIAEAAANALLKTLEEPGLATIILIAPAVEALLPTLVSRCQRIPFYRLSREQMTQVLQQASDENLQMSPTILAIAQGSPGDAIAAIQQLQAIPAELIKALTHPPRSLHSALDLARQIDKTLETEAQLWLIDYLQHAYWQQFLAGDIQHSPLPYLEQAKKYLRSYAQPRLVWEVTFLQMSQLQPQ